MTGKSRSQTAEVFLLLPWAVLRAGSQALSPGSSAMAEVHLNEQRPGLAMRGPVPRPQGTSPIRGACQASTHLLSTSIYIGFAEGGNTKCFKALHRGEGTTKPWDPAGAPGASPELTPGPTKGCS